LSLFLYAESHWYRDFFTMFKNIWVPHGKFVIVVHTCTPTSRCNHANTSSGVYISRRDSLNIAHSRKIWISYRLFEFGIKPGIYLYMVKKRQNLLLNNISLSILTGSFHVTWKIHTPEIRCRIWLYHRIHSNRKHSNNRVNTKIQKLIHVF